MTTEIEPLNAALAKSLLMPPALVEAIQDDPDLLVKLTRGQLAVVQDRLVRRALTDPDISIAQLATIHEALARAANVKGIQPAAQATAAQSVVIQIIRSPAKGEGLTIEGKATQVDFTPA